MSLQRCQELVAAAASQLRDPQGRALAAAVQWWPLEGLPEAWPVAVVNPDAPDHRGGSDPGGRGPGEPVLLLHGFDSSFLEFRRLAPLLSPGSPLYVPDLFGFGFCPRPADLRYGPPAVLEHLEALVTEIQRRHQRPVGLIGASMGGAVAVELARRLGERISRLLLLAPAGLTGRPMPLPPLLDGLGVRFLALPGVRRGLCRSAFADPEQGVGAAELEIASLHLQTPGWAEALRRFARSGGFAGCGAPLPPQPIQVLWGADDRILRPPLKRAAQALLGERVEELAHCGHLPHIDQPQTVARRWLATACRVPEPLA